MLARVAENMYWMARYLERAEDLARLIDVTTHLHLDLPRGSAPSWGSLLTLIDAEDSFREKHGAQQDEGRVLRFLLGDRGTRSTPCSVRHRKKSKSHGPRTPGWPRREGPGSTVSWRGS